MATGASAATPVHESLPVSDRPSAVGGSQTDAAALTPPVANGGSSAAVSIAASKVVYVCDASGSMIDKIETQKQELRGMVDALRPVDTFNVIFFKEGSFKALSTDGRLIPATGDAKRRAFEFIRTMYIGPSSDPVAALGLAFKEHPDLIFLFTDGEFDNNMAVFDRLAKLNKDKRAKLNTILLLPSRESADDSQELARGEKDLKKIAAEHGGMFRSVRVKSGSQRP